MIMEQLKNALGDLPYQLGDVLVVEKKATFIKVTVERIIIDNNGLSFDRLDRDDLKEWVVAEGWDKNQVKEIITRVVFKELGGRMESEAHLESQLEYWFKDL